MAFEFVTETFDRLVAEALSEHKDFVYEGHFTNEATWDIPRQFMAAGYRIHLTFFGLRDTDLSESRVMKRSSAGGHYVDPRTVTENFYGNPEKLHQHYSMFNLVQLIDTSETEHQVVAIFEKGQPALAIPAKDLPRWGPEQFTGIHP